MNKLDVPIFTISFCAIILIIYILDNFLIIPKTETVSLKEKLWAGHNKGYINHALHLSEKKIKSGQVWRLISSALLHIGTWHIVSNIIATLIVGWAVESQLGTAKIAICYIGATLVSRLYMAFVYKLQEGEGASTGIYGLIAVFVMLAIKKRNCFLFTRTSVGLGSFGYLYSWWNALGKSHRV